MTTSKKALTLESGEVSLAEPIQVTPGTPYAIYFKYKASYLSNGSASLFIGTKEIPLPNPIHTRKRALPGQRMTRTSLRSDPTLLRSGLPRKTPISQSATLQ
jgi:hypothetical protein